MKKAILIFLLLLFVFLTTSCANSDANNLKNHIKEMGELNVNSFNQKSYTLDISDTVRLIFWDNISDKRIYMRSDNLDVYIDPSFTGEYEFSFSEGLKIHDNGETDWYRLCGTIQASKISKSTTELDYDSNQSSLPDSTPEITHIQQRAAEELLHILSDFQNYVSRQNINCTLETMGFTNYD